MGNPSFIMPVMILLLLCLLLGLVRGAAAANCMTELQGKTYQKCMNLHSQGASIAWSAKPDHTLEIAFSGQLVSPGGWVAWGINPVSANAMVGTRCLIAFRGPCGSPTVLPYILDAAVKNQQKLLVPHKLDLHVLSSSVELVSSQVRIFASIRLGSNQTLLNHVWNRGSTFQGYSPGVHGFSADDLRATQTVEMLSGYAPSKPEYRGPDRQKLRTAHGILNSLSWGFLLLLGVISSRYMSQFQSMDPTWFYIHISLQLTAFIMGSAGWAIGLKLGQLSPGQHEFHRTLAMTIFTLGSIQMLALLCRPKKTNKFRRYWKSYHHFVGYACTIISVVNVFQGIELMHFSQESYIRLLYSLVVSSLIGVSAALEVNSWILYYNRREDENEQKLQLDQSDQAAQHGLFRTL